MPILKPATANELPPMIAGRYRVEQQLGRGGAGEVLCVTDTSTGQQLALKRLDRDASPRLTSLFELEYQTLASLRHAHTVRVHEFGRDEAGAFYTMELLEGEDLKQLAPMPWREVCSALRDAALALSVLHARGMVHRDVSPKNLWRMPDGRVKLIDFGAVSQYGPAAYVIGTPPFIPPEVVRKEPLDQRSDLYALGATGYYLLTGVHAFPAHEVRELPALWLRPPLPPSAAKLLRGAHAQESIPAELDALLLALLRDDPLARPTSTAELIDRLTNLLGPERHARADSEELHFENVAFVGRARELRRFRKQLRLAAQAHGQFSIIEAQTGMGRTRFVHTLALEARVADAVVLQVDAASYPEQYGTADALANKLLDALPEHARSAAAPFAAALAHISPRLAARLGMGVERPPEIAGELRVRVQSALRDWLLALTQTHTLVVLIDGLERADEGTRAFLLSLCHARSTARLLVVCTQLLTARDRETMGPLERALRHAARLESLTGLSEAESFALLSCVFGHADNLARLVSRLQHITQGCPGHLLELAAALVRSDVIRFVEGTWVLPQEIPDAALPKSREAALLSRLQLLPAAAREVGRLLSVATGALDPQLCAAVSGVPASAGEAAIAQLCEHEVMTRDQDGLRFAHELLREQLLSELAGVQRKAAQLALGRYLQRLSDSPLTRLRAGVYLLEGGDLSAVPLIIRAAAHITLYEPDRLAPAAELLERALPLLRAAGRSDAELMGVLSPLAVAGYFVDRRFAARYANDALATLSRTFSLPLVPKLARFLGARLALFAVLTFACIRYMLRGKAAPKLQDALILLFMTSAALAASSALCYDYDSTLKAAQLLEPFAVLGDHVAAGFSYNVGCGLCEGVTDSFGNTYARWQRTVELLESQRRIIGLPDNLRVRYLGGLLFAMGIIESQSDDDRAMQRAQRLDRMGVALYPMNTDQLRAMHHAHQGDAQRYQHFRDRSEQRAIQQGAIWQNETWALLVQTIVSHRHHDAMAAKRASEQLTTASKTVPTLSVFADRSRGIYLLLRERYAEALPWLARCLQEPLRSNFGWGRAHGALARAYNELGRHAEAVSACERALSVFTQGDLAFPGLTLLLECEHLVARAGLGEHAAAQRTLSGLLDQHAPNAGALTNGELHETGMRIALLTQDEAAAREHCAHMTQWYKRTRISSLVQRCELLSARLERTLGPEPLYSMLSMPAPTGLTTRSSELQWSNEVAAEQRTAQALALLTEDAGCERGYYFSVHDDGTFEQRAVYGQAPLEADVGEWLTQRVRTSLNDATINTTTLSDDDPLSATDPAQLALQDARFRAIPVVTHATGTRRVVGLLLLATRSASAPACSPTLLASLTQHLCAGSREANDTLRD